MTVIVNTIWGRRVSQAVDRQISLQGVGSSASVVDEMSTKACVVLCSDALVSISYTGIAVVHGRWTDTVVASCLSHRDLSAAVIQSGAPCLARPLHYIIRELSINLNRCLNSDSRARKVDLTLSVVGWHLGKKPRPLAWKLIRGSMQSDGQRFFEVHCSPVGRFLRQHPRGLWAETLGDPGITVDDRVRGLEKAVAFTHDDVERHVELAIAERSMETMTVGRESLAIRLDPFDTDGQVQVTRYPSADSYSPEQLMTCWVLSPMLISSPGTEYPSGCAYSACGKYLVGGFSAGRLKVRTRLPLEMAHYGLGERLEYGTQERRPTL